jgi:hypothetical protein
LPVGNGGTNLTSYAVGDVVYASGTTTLSKLAKPGTPADEVLTFATGASAPSWVALSGGTSWQSSIVTGTTLTAVVGNGYWIDTTSNICTVTLPASASVGDSFEFVDYDRTWGTNNMTLDPNGLKFQGTTTDAVYDTSGKAISIIYSGATQGWIPSNDNTVANKGSLLVEFKIWAAGGGGSAGGADGRGGGSGGFVQGTVSFSSAGATVIAVVGQGGSGGTAGKGGGGAGYSGIFNASVSQGNSLLIAGGGSGGARGSDYGKGGGGLTGIVGDGTGGGGAGSQVAGGAAGAGGSSAAGSALQGGSATAGSGGTAFGGGGDGGGDAVTYTAGGGSGGYYGGGSGGASSGSGGTGSSYVGTATSTTNTQGTSATTGITGGAAVNTGDAQYASSTNTGGTGNNSSGAGNIGQHGSISYSINSASWVTLSYTGGNQTINVS